MPQFAYAFDPHAANDDNIVRDEAHVLSATMSPYRVIIPNFAPFFEDLEIEVKCNNKPLLMGVDYYLSHKYFTGIERTGKLMYSGIWIVNPKLSGTVTVKYRTLGGKFPVQRSIIDDYLTNRQTDPQHATWEEVINDDPVFPPVDLQFDRDSFVDEENVQTAIREIADVVRNKDQTTNDMYMLLDDWFLQLKKVVDESPLKSHQDNFNNPHGEVWFESQALHEAGIAKDTAKVAGMTINQLADYVNSRGITQADLDNYVKRSGGNTVVGDIVLKDGLMFIEFLHANNAYLRINMSNGNIGFDAISDALVHADKDKNSPGAKATLRSGDVELTVTSRGTAQTDDDLRINDKTIIHDGNLEAHVPDAGTHIIDIQTKDSVSLNFSGKGVAGNPLKADATLDDATTSVPGIAVGTVDETKDQPTKVALSQGTAKVDAKIKAKVPDTVKINGVRLDRDITLTKDKFGLGNVDNLSDMDMPVNQNHENLLANKAVGDHTHSFAEMGFARATEATYGITFLSDDPTSSATDRGFSAAKMSDLNTEVMDLEYVADTRLPDDVIDITQYGGNSYLPIPVQGRYGEAGDDRGALAIVGLVEPDGKLVCLRNGLDMFGYGVYYWYADVLSDGSLANEVSTATRYEPKYLKDKGYEGNIRRVHRGTDDCFMAYLDDGTAHIVLTNGTMDMSRHIGCRVDKYLVGWAWSVVMANGYVYAFLSAVNNDAYYTKLYRVSVDDIINKDYVEWEERGLSGVDHFGTQHTNVLEFDHVPRGIGSDADPNHLMVRQDNSHWGTINLCHGPARNFDFLQEGTKIRILHTSSIYLANSYSSRWQGNWSTSYLLDLATGQITLDHGGFPVYLRADGFHFENGTLLGNHTPYHEANNTAGVIRSKGYAFTWNYSNIARPAYLVPLKFSDGSEPSLEKMKRQNHAVKTFGSAKTVRGNYGSPVEATVRAVVLLPNNYFAAEHTNDKTVLVRYDPDNPYEGQSGFGPTSDRKSIPRALYSTMMRVPFIVDSNGNQRNEGVMFGSYTKTGAQPRRIASNDTVNGVTAELAAGVFDSVESALRSINDEQTNSSVLATQQTGIHVFGDIKNMNDVDVYVTYCATFAVEAGNINGKRNLLVTAYKATITTQVTGEHVTITKVTVGAEVRKAISAGSFRAVAGPSDSVAGSTRAKMADGTTLFTLGYLPYYTTVGGSTGMQIGIWRESDGTERTRQWRISYAYGNGGAYYLPNKGQFWLSHGTASESLTMTVRAPGYSGFDTTVSTEVFAATKVAEGWVIYFTQDVQFFINSTRFMIPKTSFDLSVGFPTTHRENTFYIYASVDGGEPHYVITDQYVADSSTAIYIGFCKTDATQITELSVNRATRMGEFREFTEHLTDPKPHGLDLSQVTTDDIGLGLLENKDIRHSLVVPTFKEIFDGWYRLSHQAEKPYPAIPAETTTWTYNAATDSIFNTTNSSSFVGMVSPADVTVGDYDFITGVKSANGDDDWIGVIFAMVEKDGIQHTLTALCSGTDTRNDHFSVHYNWNQTANRGQKTLYSHTTTLKHGWDEIPERIITVKRRGDVFTIHVTKMMTDAATERTFSFDVKDHPELAALFRGAVRFGYCAQSQASSTWRNILRPDEDGKNFYASQKLYRDNFSWSSRLKTISGVVAPTVNGNDYDTYDVPIPAEYRDMNYHAWCNIDQSSDSGGGISTMELSHARVGDVIRFTAQSHNRGGFYTALLRYNITFFNDVRMI